MEWRFSFDAKAGNIASGTNNSTAVAFIKIIDPNSNFAQTGGDQITLTDTPTDWRFYSLSTTIEAAQVGQIFQIGFWSVASNFEDSGVFYDNLNLASAAATAGIFGRATVTQVSAPQVPPLLTAPPSPGHPTVFQSIFTLTDFAPDGDPLDSLGSYDYAGASSSSIIDFGSLGAYQSVIDSLRIFSGRVNGQTVIETDDTWELVSEAGGVFAVLSFRETLNDLLTDDSLTASIDTNAFLSDPNANDRIDIAGFSVFFDALLDIDAASTQPIGQVAPFDPYTPRDLTPNMIVDEARTGGADIDFNTGSEVFLAWEVDAGWTPGEQASLTGLALPIQTNGSDKGTLTLSFYGLSGGPNPNQFDGEASETFLGSRTLEFINPDSGVNVFAGLFDEPLNFTTDATGFAVRLQNTGKIRLKRIGAGGTNPTASEQIRIDNGLRAGGGGNYYALSWAGQSLLTDLNADGETNFFDTLTLLQDFDAGPADYNGDAFTNNTDLLDYLLALDLIPSPGTR